MASCYYERTSLILLALLYFSLGIQNQHLLVKPQWVSGLISGQVMTSNGYVIIQTNDGPAEIEYDHGHIPGAIHLDTNWIEKPPLWNLVPELELKNVFRQLGICQ